MSSIFDLGAEYNRSRVIKDLDARDIEIEKLQQQLATLREAGEKMAERLRVTRNWAKTSGFENADLSFTMEDAAALEAWEAANK